jgi:hypothetical protein
VGLTDNIGLIEPFEEFVAFATDRKPMIPVIYQDSSSVVSLVTKQVGVTRGKHLQARKNLAKEAIKENCIVVKHVMVPKMKANGFREGHDPKESLCIMILNHILE